MNNPKSMIEKYKKMGFKVTPQRLAILTSLKGEKSHPGVWDIFNRLKKGSPTLSLTTVYNTLEVLKKIGEVRELTLDRCKVRYDPDTSLHNHILCIKCKKVEDLHIGKKSPGISKKRINGYRIIGVSKQFYGICKDCQEH